MKKLMLASVILANSQMAISANWVPSQSSSVEYKETTHIDWDSIKGYYFNGYDKTGYYVNAWIKKNYPTAQKLNNGKLYREAKLFYYVDCVNQKNIVGEGYWYTSKGGIVDSDKVYVPTYSSDTWYRNIPGSIGETIATDICAYYQIKQFSQK